MKIFSLACSLCCVFLFACASSGLYSPQPQMAKAEMSMEYKSLSSADDPGALNRSDSLMVSSNLSTDGTSSPGQAEARLKVYFGTLRLMVGSPDEVRSRIAGVATDSGGYVESMYQDYIVIRVPKAQFEEIFRKIMSLGDVLNKTVETFDVTEAFQDLSTRLKVATTARERLYTLLEKTEDVQQRLLILKEIRRLTEEIELIGLKLEGLKQLVAFSRITVELVARLADQQDLSRSGIPYPWIASLDPFHTSLDYLNRNVELRLGEDFAVFKEDDYFHAETFSGIRFRVASVRNFPAGNSLFWQEALLHHLGSYYQTAEALTCGEFYAVRFTSKDRSPFIYLVGVKVIKKKIYVVEVLFPDANLASQAMEEVLQSIGNMQIKGRKIF